ncbi:hypothetical protein Nepgr_028703 [Nepenthes gracilis]|uniref:Uncharacterized protein n=1 Tax=Nepenthes gracilis TaxID=150966 RepID=A0AAD3TC59_NEPGR|nr:hypothetical protein Nepgr_028703 [Nepenthes gracilis]
MFFLFPSFRRRRVLVDPISSSFAASFLKPPKFFEFQQILRRRSSIQSPKRISTKKDSIKRCCNQNSVNSEHVTHH